MNDVISLYLICYILFCFSAAGLAVASAIDNDGILANVAARGKQLRSLAEDLKNRVPGLIKDVRGWGLINGVELTEESGLTAADVTKVLMENGVLVVPAGPKVISQQLYL